MKLNSIMIYLKNNLTEKFNFEFWDMWTVIKFNFEIEFYKRIETNDLLLCNLILIMKFNFKISNSLIHSNSLIDSKLICYIFEIKFWP